MPDPLAEMYPQWSPYVYAANNPMKYIDPNGETIQVDSSGNTTYINDNTDQVTYWDPTGGENNQGTYVTLQNADGNNITEADFNIYVATIYGESSGNSTESAAIANVIVNRADALNTDVVDIIQNTGIYGYGNTAYNSVHGSYANTNTNLIECRLGVVNALTGGTDNSQSSYFWEGTSFLTANNTSNFFVQSGWGTTTGSTSGIIHYLIQTTIGGTTFMINNPLYHGTRNYP